MKKDDLLIIFNQLKTILKKYEPPLLAKTDYQTKYELEFDKDYQTKSLRTGKVAKKHGLYFAAIIVQSGYVGLYFMPIHSHKEAFKNLSPGFMKLLKGKSCFHIKTLDQETISEIKGMLDKGYQIYKNFNHFY